MMFAMNDAVDAKPARGRRRNDPGATRSAVLDAAFDLFQAQGYNATGVHDIARKAAVTGGALHHHFGTKKAIGLAVIRERAGPALQETWLEPVRNARTARRGIMSVFARVADQLDRQGTVQGCPVNNLTLELAFADPDYRSELFLLFDLWRATIAEKLRGEGVEDSAALAALTVAGYSGAMAMAKVEQGSGPLRLCAFELEKRL